MFQMKTFYKWHVLQPSRNSFLSLPDCVVTENKQEESDKRDVITVRLQGKEKASVQEYSIQKVYVFLDVLLVLCAP